MRIEKIEKPDYEEVTIFHKDFFGIKILYRRYTNSNWVQDVDNNLFEVPLDEQIQLEKSYKEYKNARV